MEVAALVGLHVWLRNLPQSATSALVRCCGGFPNPMTTTFLVVCGILCCGDAAELVNNIPYLLFDPLERTHDKHHHTDRRTVSNTPVLPQIWRAFFGLRNEENFQTDHWAFVSDRSC
jgi:hypothetical protein